jgi:hypothetical protein
MNKSAVRIVVSPEGLTFGTIAEADKWARGYVGGVPVCVVKRDGSIWRQTVGTGDAAPARRAPMWGGISPRLYEKPRCLHPRTRGGTDVQWCADCDMVVRIGEGAPTQTETPAAESTDAR